VAADGLSDDIREFFFRKFDSVELLDVLALLHENPEQLWTIKEISAHLRSSDSSVAKRVAALIERLVIAAASFREGGVRYAPLDSRTDELVGRAISFYRLRPYQVVEIIFSRRDEAIRSIADAFRFRKED
jgi:hypothetical protein